VNGLIRYHIRWIFVLAALSAIAPRPAAAQGPALPALYALPYHWTQDDGSTLTLDAWRGRPVLLAMAYSSCRETCFYTLHRLEQFEREARARHLELEIIVVTLDPRTDNPQTWASYRRRRGLTSTHWHFLTGSEQATRALADLLGVRFWNYDEHVMHEFRIAYVDADGHADRSLDWESRDQDVLAGLFPTSPRPHKDVSHD
jgi:protein SCO1